MRATAAACLFALTAGPAAAQYAPTPAGVVHGPTARFPRLSRALQVVADPTLLLSPNSRLSSGQPPTPYPILDAGPNLSNLASIGTLSATSASANALAFGLPPAIRAVRVALVGPPPIARDRRETLLWIAEPTLVVLKHRREAKRGQAAGGCGGCGGCP